MMLRWFKRRPRWTTPHGFSTPFSRYGDPALDIGERRAELYAQVFQTHDGRRVLSDMLARAGIGAPFSPGISEAEGRHNSGMQAFALDIAQLAGLDTGAMGRALTSGQLEAMSDETDLEDIED